MVDTFDCARAQIYHNTGKLTPAQIKAKNRLHSHHQRLSVQREVSAGGLDGDRR